MCSALSQTPSFTDTPQSGWTRTRYGGTGVGAPVEGISLHGVGHNLPLHGQAAMAIQFFGLDTQRPGPGPDRYAGAERAGESDRHPRRPVVRSRWRGAHPPTTSA